MEEMELYEKLYERMTNVYKKLDSSIYSLEQVNNNLNLGLKISGEVTIFNKSINSLKNSLAIKSEKIKKEILPEIKTKII